MHFSHSTLALFAVLTTVVSVAAAPNWCPPGGNPATVTVTVTVEVPVPTGNHPAPAPTHSIPHTIAPRPTPTSSPSSGGSGNGNGNGNGNGGGGGGGYGTGGGNGNGGSNGNGSGSGSGGRPLRLCCNEKGQADSAVISLLAGLLGLDLSGKSGLVGVVCNIIGEGNLASNCAGSLLNCGFLSGVGGLGSECTV